MNTTRQRTGYSGIFDAFTASQRLFSTIPESGETLRGVKRLADASASNPLSVHWRRKAAREPQKGRNYSYGYARPGSTAPIALDFAVSNNYFTLKNSFDRSFSIAFPAANDKCRTAQIIMQ